MGGYSIHFFTHSLIISFSVIPAYFLSGPQSLGADSIPACFERKATKHPDGSLFYFIIIRFYTGTYSKRYVYLKLLKGVLKCKISVKKELYLT